MIAAEQESEDSIAQFKSAKPQVTELGGSTRTLFFVADDYCDKDKFVELSSSLLQAGVTVCSLPGIEGAPFDSIEQLAAQHLEAIRALQPSGPYRLAGLSSGGLVAYEMAVRLIGDDESVEFLGMINSSRPRNEAGKNVRSENPAIASRCAEVCNRYCPQPLPIAVHLFAAEGAVRALSRDWELVADRKVRWEVVQSAAGVVPGTLDLQRLGEAMAHSLNDAGASRDAAGPKYSSILTIQSGRTASCPIFCVPGAGANVTSFLALTDALGPDISVHGLQPRGLDGMFVPHSSVAGAANAYLRDIEKIDRHGPLRLLGHSFGGWIVYEMACQLVARGHKVASIVVIDTQPPMECVSLRHLGRVDVLMQLVRILEQANDTSLGITRAGLDALSYEAQLSRLLESMKSAALMPQSAKLDALRSLVRVFATNINTSYVPVLRFSGDVLLIQAQDPFCNGGTDTGCDELDDGAAEAWTSYATRVMCVKAPGNHMTMLKKPNINAIAAHVRRFWAES